MAISFAVAALSALPIALVYYLLHYIRWMFSCTFRGDHKLAVVTGAAGDIGRATVVRLVSDGWTVIACDINSVAWETHLPTLNLKTPERVVFHKLDVAASASRRELLSFIKDFIASEKNEVSHLNAFVSIAGINQWQPVATLEEEQLDTILNVNAVGVVKLTNMLIPLLLKSSTAANIVAVTSINARVQFLNIGAYAVSKAALNAYFNVLRKESMQSGLNKKLKISMVEPGPVSTHMATDLYKKQLEYTETVKMSEDEDVKERKSPWNNGLIKVAENTKNLVEKYGVKIESISVTPDDVAKVILTSLRSQNPKERYVVCGYGVGIMFYLALLLPEALGDRVIALFS